MILPFLKGPNAEYCQWFTEWEAGTGSHEEGVWAVGWSWISAELNLVEIGVCICWQGNTLFAMLPYSVFAALLLHTDAKHCLGQCYWGLCLGPWQLWRHWVVTDWLLRSKQTFELKGMLLNISQFMKAVVPQQCGTCCISSDWELWISTYAETCWGGESSGDKMVSQSNDTENPFSTNIPDSIGGRVDWGWRR